MLKHFSVFIHLWLFSTKQSCLTMFSMQSMKKKSNVSVSSSKMRNVYQIAKAFIYVFRQMS